MLSIERNRCSPPCDFAHEKLNIRLHPERIEAHNEEGIVAAQARSFEPGDVTHEWQRYIPLAERKPGAPFDDLPTALQRLRPSLIKGADDDRLMAEVLACIPKHGLEPVPVAVELMLDLAHTSAEHINNVLSRIEEAPPPATIETTLTVEEPPIADAGRYDRLTVEAHHA